MVLHYTDRLSALPDNALQRILFHLNKSDEAARTSALSHRWRRVSASVPAVDLIDPKLRPRRWDDKPVCFDQQVTSAILSKGPATPIRVLRIRWATLTSLYGSVLCSWFLTSTVNPPPGSVDAQHALPHDSISSSTSYFDVSKQSMLLNGWRKLDYSRSDFSSTEMK